MNTDIPIIQYDYGRKDQEPAFAEPWEAHAFAIALMLSEKGLLKWSEWSNALSEVIKNAKVNRQADLGKTYYQFWLSALENILIEKNILDNSDIKSRTEQWRKAFQSTPHGNPLKLVKYK